MGCWAKMGWVNAKCIMANVIYFYWQISETDKERKPMDGVIPPIIIKPPIIGSRPLIAIPQPCPYPTTSHGWVERRGWAILVYLGPEVRDSVFAAHGLPQNVPASPSRSNPVAHGRDRQRLGWREWEHVGFDSNIRIIREFRPHAHG